MTSALPRLLGGAPYGVRNVRAAVLVLHGGREHSQARASSTQPAALRMWDMVAGLRAASRGAAVYLLRYRVRGWNPDPAGRREPDPVVDVRWALDQVRVRHGDVPVAILGHSMGGRAGFAVADDVAVAGVCGLAPWLPDGEPLAAVRSEQRFVIAHGTADTMTSPPASLRYAERLRATGASVARLELAAGRHALLDRPRLWHHLAVSVPLGLVGDRELPPAVVAAFEAEPAEGLRLPLRLVSGRPHDP